MQQEGSNLFLELLKAIPNCSGFVYFFNSVVNALPLLVVKLIGIVNWSTLIDHICTFEALDTHADLCT